MNSSSFNPFAKDFIPFNASAENFIPPPLPQPDHNSHDGLASRVEAPPPGTFPDYHTIVSSHLPPSHFPMSYHSEDYYPVPYPLGGGIPSADPVPYPPPAVSFENVSPLPTSSSSDSDAVSLCARKAIGLTSSSAMTGTPSTSSSAQTFHPSFQSPSQGSISADLSTPTQSIVLGPTVRLPAPSRPSIVDPSPTPFNRDVKEKIGGINIGKEVQLAIICKRPDLIDPKDILAHRVSLEMLQKVIKHSWQIFDEKFKSSTNRGERIEYEFLINKPGGGSKQLRVVFESNAGRITLVTAFYPSQPRLGNDGTISTTRFYSDKSEK